MNPIIYIGLQNSNGCNCENDEWGWRMGHEFINPRMDHNLLIIDDLTSGATGIRKRLDCYHIDRPTEYDYVNLIFKFKNGEERRYDLTKREQLSECLQMMEEYTLNGNDLEAPSKFEVANEIEFMDI
jgi:hypothetical protein